MELREIPYFGLQSMQCGVTQFSFQLNKQPITQSLNHPRALKRNNLSRSRLSRRRNTRGRARSKARRGTARRSTATTTHTGVLVLNTALLSIPGSRVGAVTAGGVDTKRDPGKDTLGDVVAEQDVVDDGVGARGGLLAHDGVVGVGGEFLRVGGVGLGLFDFGDQVLVEEDLADVRGAGVVEAGEGAVGQDGDLVGGVGEHYL